MTTEEHNRPAIASGLLLGLLLAAGQAAGQPAQPAKPAPAPADDEGKAARVILVTQDGGSYDVAVHPRRVTVLYFPDEVLHVFASDKKNFQITLMADSVALRPKAGDPSLTANLNVITKTLKISILLSIAPEGDAVTQVIFKNATAEEELERRVTEEVGRRTAALEAQTSERLAGFDDEVRQRADAELATRMLHRAESVGIGRIARHVDGVIVRVERAMYVGDDAYLFFEVQNRGNGAYRVATVQLRNGADDVGGMVKLQTGAVAKGEGGPVGSVPSGGRARGVLVVRDADKLQRRSLTLTVAERNGRRPVTVEAITLR